MHKFVADILVNVAIVDTSGNLIRTENLEWNAENGDNLILTQPQLRDAIDTLCEFLDVPNIPIATIKEKKSDG